MNRERGSEWLLSQVPGLEVVGPHGSLLGDFAADAMVWRFGDGGELRLNGIAWQGLAARRASGPAWLFIRIERLHAQSLQVTMPRSTGANLAPPPEELVLPIELLVQSLGIDEVRAGPLGPEPLRALRARVHLGDDAGRLHRIESLAVSRGLLQANGHARLGAQAPMPVAVALDLRQAEAGRWPGWNARLALTGPLARSALEGQLTTVTAPAQTLVFDAKVRPFETWPLDALHAQAKALDLSAVIAEAPQTALNGRIDLTAAEADRPLALHIDLSNAEPGAWNAGRVPLRSVAMRLSADPLDRSRLALESLDVQLAGGESPAGRLTGNGGWSASQGWTLDVALHDLRADRLDTRAVPMRVDGQLGLRSQAPGGGIAVTARLDGRPVRRSLPPLALQIRAAWRT